MRTVEVTLKSNQGSFSVVLTVWVLDTWDILAYRALVELRKQGKPVSEHDRVSFGELN